MYTKLSYNLINWSKFRNLYLFPIKLCLITNEQRSVVKKLCITSILLGASMTYAWRIRRAPIDLSVHTFFWTQWQELCLSIKIGKKVYVQAKTNKIKVSSPPSPIHLWAKRTQELSSFGVCLPLSLLLPAFPFESSCQRFSYFSPSIYFRRCR